MKLLSNGICCVVFGLLLVGATGELTYATNQWVVSLIIVPSFALIVHGFTIIGVNTCQD
jgi:hypothetical protein